MTTWNKRIQRDYRDLLRDKVEMGIPFTVGIEGDDMRRFRVNYLPTEGRYAGQPVHVHIDVPSSYPSQPLDVSIETPGFEHPNVFDEYICLDMLKPPEAYAAPYTGWSAAYSLSSVIMQLYGFLMVDDTVEQMYGEQRCTTLDPDVPYERLPSTVQCRCGFCELPTNAAAAANVPDLPGDVPELPGDVLSKIMGLADGTTLAKLAINDATDPLTQSAVDAKHRAEKRCYFSKESPLEDRTVLLGLGVCVTRRHQRQGGDKVELSIASTDPLSSAAFVGADVRLSPWNIPFDAFLPIILNADHAQRALNALPRFLPDMSATGDDLVGVIARLFNGLVVELMRTKTNAGVARHMSDAALATFCHLHHLLVAVARRNPGIVDECTRDVLRFVREPAARRKTLCPDLGLLMVKYLLVPLDRARWSDFAPAFLREAFARHVMWINAARFTAPVHGESDADRLNDHLNGALVSLRLICLMAFFANALARPSSEATKARELENIEAAYNRSNGDPPYRVSELFYGHARCVMELSSWTNVMSLLRLRLNVPGVGVENPAAKTRAFANVLRQAVVDSCDTGYHRAPRGWVRVAFHSWEPSPLVAA